MSRYDRWARAATAAMVVVGSAAFGLAGSASAAAGVGAVHDLTGEYNVSSNGSLACPPGQPLATDTCYLVGSTGTFSYTATSSTTNVIVPVTDGVAGTAVRLAVDRVHQLHLVHLWAELHRALVVIPPAGPPSTGWTAAK